jgi:hypothetical protein
MIRESGDDEVLGFKVKCIPHIRQNVPSTENIPSGSTSCAKHGVAIITTMTSVRIVFFIRSSLPSSCPQS